MNKSLVVAIALVPLLSCMHAQSKSLTHADNPSKDVQHGQVSAFLAVARSRDYHTICRIGSPIFTAGSTVKDHGRVFESFPSRITSEGLIAYQFYFAQSDSGVADASLYLKPGSGEVVELRCVEAWK